MDMFKGEGASCLEEVILAMRSSNEDPFVDLAI
jgi:hypothetical protein